MLGCRVFRVVGFKVLGFVVLESKKMLVLRMDLSMSKDMRDWWWVN